MEIGIFGLIGLAFFILHIWAIIDVVRTPGPVWAAAGQNQLLWGLIVLFLGVLGPILYLMIARPQLIAAAASTRQA